MTRKLTHDERVLALLADGKPHSHHELYALYVVAHSRVASLRRKGHRIGCVRRDGTYWYTLTGPLTEGATGGGVHNSPRSASAPGRVSRGFDLAPSVSGYLPLKAGPPATGRPVSSFDEGRREPLGNDGLPAGQLTIFEAAA